MKISVIIPVLDDAGHLAECLDTLRRQTRQPDEIIVVDNGSTDGSDRVAIAAGATLVRESRPGIPAAAARGFDEACGDLIARCDADSRLPHDWLERIERRMLARPDLVAITGPARFYDLGRTAGALARVFYLGAYFTTMRAALGNNVVFGSNFAIRAPAWRAMSDGVPRDDTELHDDMDLSYRLHPAVDVEVDRALVVGISGRPFTAARAFCRRLARARHTLARHWPEQSPTRRWHTRVTRRRQGGPVPLVAHSERRVGWNA